MMNRSKHYEILTLNKEIDCLRGKDIIYIRCIEWQIHLYILGTDSSSSRDIVLNNPRKSAR